MPTADSLAQELAPVAKEVLANCELIAAAAKKESDLFARAPQDVFANTSNSTFTSPPTASAFLSDGRQKLRSDLEHLLREPAIARVLYEDGGEECITLLRFEVQRFRSLGPKIESREPCFSPLQGPPLLPPLWKMRWGSCRWCGTPWETGNNIVDSAGGGNGESEGQGSDGEDGDNWLSDYIHTLWWLMHHSLDSNRKAVALAHYVDDSGTHDASKLVVMGGPVFFAKALL